MLERMLNWDRWGKQTAENQPKCIHAYTCMVHDGSIRQPCQKPAVPEQAHAGVPEHALSSDTCKQSYAGY